MEECFGGGYVKVKLKDGSFGNYDVAEKYFRRLETLAEKHSQKFNELCQSAISGSEPFPSGKAMQALLLAGLAYDGLRPQLAYPAEDIRDIVILCAQETRLSKIFGFFGKNPQYDLVSPFENFYSQDPGSVSPKDKTFESFDWSGAGGAKHPGSELRPF